MPGKVHVTTTINGESAEFLCEPRQTILEVLRDQLDLTGTKRGLQQWQPAARVAYWSTERLSMPV